MNGPHNSAREAEGCVGEEGKRQRVEEGHVAEVELDAPRDARVVIEAEWNADSRRGVFGHEGHGEAPARKPSIRRAPRSRVAAQAKTARKANTYGLRKKVLTNSAPSGVCEVGIGGLARGPSY